MKDGSPDWGALYASHRDAMYRVASRILRDAGIADQADDVVNDAMLSLISSPPKAVQNWEAIMVTVAKRRALDRIGTAAVRHAGSELDTDLDGERVPDIADDVADDVDRQRICARIWDHLGILDDRHRKVAWEYVALDRPRAEVAAELGVTPGRVSQMAKTALEKLRDELRSEGENI